jgi:hypothetical protein
LFLVKSVFLNGSFSIFWAFSWFFLSILIVYLQLFSFFFFGDWWWGFFWVNFFSLGFLCLKKKN